MTYILKCIKLNASVDCGDRAVGLVRVCLQRPQTIGHRVIERVKGDKVDGVVDGGSAVAT